MDMVDCEAVDLGGTDEWKSSIGEKDQPVVESLETCGTGTGFSDGVRCGTGTGLSNGVRTTSGVSVTQPPVLMLCWRQEQEYDGSRHGYQCWRKCEGNFNFLHQVLSIKMTLFGRSSVTMAVVDK
jgi:hypothetical protein